jgi:hypothetical protein
VQNILWKIIEVGSLFRPLVVNKASLELKENRYIRGGNTIVFNSDWLDEIEHPKMPRRGDTIWALMINKLGAKLGHFPIPLRHIRDPMTENWTPQGALDNWLRRLEVDLIGASFQRWFAKKNSQHSSEEILVERCSRQLRAFAAALELALRMPEEIRIILVNFINSGIERVTNLSNNPFVFEAYHQSVKHLDSIGIHLSAYLEGVKA